MKKKRNLLIVSFALAAALVVGQAAFASNDKGGGTGGTGGTDSMMNGSGSGGMDSMMNGNDMSGMMQMMNNEGMQKMMNAMNTPEGQEMMNACGTFMETNGDKDSNVKSPAAPKTK
ncbi:MAG TPA: hypothetical protein VMS09_05725 [Paenibacillus sp.]|uniref:hypothetical protein n=1 Tax=Paenibacillus sp. TaxID=58172 RepID=UPI002BE71E74|nr:hypothetical protein [Paenibacillus sp.]HUC91518.1 hypothetical protein [Paenibacillus sp.]